MAVAAADNRWNLATEAFPEAEIVASRRLVECLGATAIRGVVELPTERETVNDSTLMAAVQLGALGDEASISLIQANAATDASERLFKVAHQSKVRMSMRGGSIEQDGRKLTDLHGNALKHTVLIPEMLRRTKQELKNALLFEELHGLGALETHDAVVFSTSSTTMTQQQKKDYGFFLDTETCSIQMLSAEGDDITLESAFVAGKKTPTSDRHDIATIQKLMETYGVAMQTDDGTELLQYVLLVPKEAVPNGVGDVVKMYDDAAGGTFYGEAKPRQDYQQYAELCEERSAQFQHIVDAITAQLLAEASSFTSPLQAIMRLDEISERLCVKYAVENTEINAAIFGEKSAMHIAEARFFIERGEHERANVSMVMAQNTADSSSCPLFKRLTPELGDIERENADSSLFRQVEDKYGSLEFTCSKGHYNKRPYGKQIDNCLQCGISVGCQEPETPPKNNTKSYKWMGEQAYNGKNDRQPKPAHEIGKKALAVSVG